MFQTLAQLEGWVGENWLYPLHSRSAHDHIFGKLLEETGELVDALRRGDPAAISGEAGDVGWCTMALPLNASLGAKELIHFLVPTVGEAGATLSNMDRWALEWLHPWAAPPTIGLDRLCQIPLPRPQAVSRYIRSRNLEVTEAVLIGLCRELGYASSKYLTHATHYPGTLRTAQFGTRTVEAMAQMLLLVSLLSQTWSGQGLSAIMERTREKHQRRLATGMPVTSIKSRSAQA